MGPADHPCPSSAPRLAAMAIIMIYSLLFTSIGSELSLGPQKRKNVRAMRPGEGDMDRGSEAKARCDSDIDRQSGVFSKSTFSSLGLHDRLLEAIKTRFNATYMTQIQSVAIPFLLKSSADVIIRAPTGSGKTLAFSVPLIQRLQAKGFGILGGGVPAPGGGVPSDERGGGLVGRAMGPLVTVILPTRELALQTYEVIQRLLGGFVRVVPGVLIGGEKPKSEKARIRKGINILIATPARLSYHVDKTQCLNFPNIETLVLDEADMLMEMGYMEDIQRLLTKIHASAKKIKYGGRVQHILLSATLPPRVERLSNQTLYKPRSIIVGEEGEMDANHAENTYSLPRGLRNHAIVAPMGDRLVALAAILRIIAKRNRKARTLVFVSCIDSVEFHYSLFMRLLEDKDPKPRGKSQKMLDKLEKRFGQPILKDIGDRESDQEQENMLHSGLSMYKLHGELKQDDRKAMLEGFSRGSGVLLTTDVAARGIDFPKVSWVVQYNTPANPSEFVHRVGRCARIGNEGDSVLFLLPEESPYSQLLTGRGVNMDAYRLDDHCNPTLWRSQWSSDYDMLNSLILT
ncbi:hypothetical protein AAMO2058_001469200 [Amorphochlora amoebiformis]